MNPSVIPIKSTTQIFTEIEDIDRDMALFSDGTCIVILTTNAVNFGLLSSNEQDALIVSYAGLLNSLSFPIQLLIRTQHKDVTSYLRILEDHEKSHSNPKIAKSIHSYREFVATMVKEKNVLDKKFYIVIPFSSIELGPSTKTIFGSKTKQLPYPKDYILDRAQAVLLPKRDHILRLLGKLGLRGSQLTNEQIAALFFSIYNPTSHAPTMEFAHKSHTAPLLRSSLLTAQKKKQEIFGEKTKTPQPLPAVVQIQESQTPVFHEIPISPDTQHISSPINPKTNSVADEIRAQESTTQQSGDVSAVPLISSKNMKVEQNQPAQTTHIVYSPATT